MEQRSLEWFEARRGKVTGSRIADVMAKTKTGWGASRANYMAQLIAERLTGNIAESYSNSAMQWGTETEPRARDAYEFFHMVEVEEVAIVNHPRIAMSSCSPDGLVGEDGLVEIKCPNTATHIDTLLTGKIKSAYIKQMQWQMICTGRQWCDFVSFDPRMPINMQLFIKRVDSDKNAVAEMEDAVEEFLIELDAKITQLKSIYEDAA